MATSEVLNFTEIPTVDEGIERFEFHQYEPVARGLLKAYGTAYANADAMSFTNNGIMHLFSQISYQLSNQQVEDVYHPGQATTILSVKTSLEKPRYIIVGFQTNKDGNQKLNPSIFDHCDLKNMYIMLNQERYPAVDYNLSFPNQQFSRAYRDAFVFSEKFYGMNKLITQSNIPPSEYKDLYPLMVFDVSKQSERLKSSVEDVQFKAKFNAAVPGNTKAFAVVISDKWLQFQSDGNKMNIVY
ncbi:uncharacterized protein LOC136082649 [Hydra vulgaris]|uniref:Uncharacterized protein LOC136082649 n=1 Tax=Hydra vulgaris TaxID=6087 RepID=A0ABM4C910_HYDVU